MKTFTAAKLRVMYSNYAELTVGFTSTFPNEAQQKYWVDCAEARIEERYGPQVLGLIKGLAEMAGSVQDEIGEIEQVVLDRAEWCAKQWPSDSEYKEVMANLPLRKWVQKIRGAYVNSNGKMRELCVQAQKELGGSIADWEQVAYSNTRLHVEVWRMGLEFKSFERVLKKCHEKSTG